MAVCKQIYRCPKQRSWEVFIIWRLASTEMMSLGRLLCPTVISRCECLQRDLPSLKLTFPPLKMDGWFRWSFPLGFRPIFRGDLVSFREGVQFVKIFSAPVEYSKNMLIIAGPNDGLWANQGKSSASGSSQFDSCASQRGIVPWQGTSNLYFFSEKTSLKHPCLFWQACLILPTQKHQEFFWIQVKFSFHVLLHVSFVKVHFLNPKLFDPLLWRGSGTRRYWSISIGAWPCRVPWKTGRVDICWVGMWRWGRGMSTHQRLSESEIGLRLERRQPLLLEAGRSWLMFDVTWCLYMFVGGMIYWLKPCVVWQIAVTGWADVCRSHPAQWGKYGRSARCWVPLLAPVLKLKKQDGKDPGWITKPY